VQVDNAGAGIPASRGLGGDLDRSHGDGGMLGPIPVAVNCRRDDDKFGHVSVYRPRSARYAKAAFRPTQAVVTSVREAT
jgi:hypothetical protein